MFFNNYREKIISLESRLHKSQKEVEEVRQTAVEELYWVNKDLKKTREQLQEQTYLNQELKKELKETEDKYKEFIADQIAGVDVKREFRNVGLREIANSISNMARRLFDKYGEMQIEIHEGTFIVNLNFTKYTSVRSSDD